MGRWVGPAFSCMEGRHLTFARAGSSVLPEAGAPMCDMSYRLAEEQHGFSRDNGISVFLQVFSCKSMSRVV